MRRPLHTGDMRHGRGCERVLCSRTLTLCACALHGASRRHKIHEIQFLRLHLGSDGRRWLPPVCQSAIATAFGSRSGLVSAASKKRPTDASSDPPFPHLQLRYFSCVFLKDIVLDNDDDHEPALGTSRSPRWCMRIVDDERSRFGDFFLSMGGRMCDVHYW